MELRDYQREAVSAIRNEWNSGHNNTLLVLATGLGKTVVAASVIKGEVDGGGRVLFLAHRDELLKQADNKINKVAALPCSYEKADEHSSNSLAPVTLGSVQTLMRETRLKEFPQDYFSLIVVDEAHHVMADSYQKVVNYFQDTKVLGLTATPSRSDKKNLSKFFESIAYEYSLKQGIRAGYLCPIKAQMIPLQLDISKVEISNGDYAVGQIGSALEPYLNQIALEMLKYCKNRKTVVFLPLVKISQAFCNMLNSYGLKAVEVNGNSSNREEILKDFEEGKYQVLCNSMLLTEGWDSPSVDCIVVLRPTKVRSLYQQMVGRGTRPCEGKSELLLLDFLWMTERHDLCRPASLVAKDEDIENRINAKVEKGEAIDLLDAEEGAEKDVVQEREEALARELAEMRKKKARLVDPIQYAFSIEAEDLASYEPTFAWEMGPATPKQLEYLELHGIYPDEVKNAGLASLLIDKLKNRQIEGLATPKQIRFLENRGFLHVGLWSFDDASRMIDVIAANGWRVPYHIDVATYVPKGVRA